MLEVIGYISVGLMGTILGLIGAGGSILTVPILVYLFGLQPVTATAYSLFVVGVAAFFGAKNNWLQKQLDFKNGIRKSAEPRKLWLKAQRSTQSGI